MAIPHYPFPERQNKKGTKTIKNNEQQASMTSI
jgi:hypothetical protein